MKLTAQVKLLPNPDQAIALQRTLEIANEACNIISQKAWDTLSYRQFSLHHLTYQTIRDTFPLTAQVVVRCIAKVADAYKIDQKVMRVFRPHGAIAYDNRILSWKLDGSEVSIWTIAGRMRIPFVCGERQQELLVGKRGESDLCIREGVFYLFTSCEVKVPEPKPVTEALGIDLGIVNIAADTSPRTVMESYTVGKP